MWEKKKLTKDAEERLHDLFRFLVEVWGLDLREEPHREICQVIQDAETDDLHPYTIVCVPRGTYKTSIARGTLVWKQLRQIYLHDNYYHRIVLASATLPLAEASLRVIERQLQTNKRLAADYGKLYINDRKRGLASHSDDGLFLSPRLLAGELASVAEPSFWVGSIRRISTGFHADEAYADDLNNKENSATDVQRKKVQDYWDLLFPIVEPKDKSGKRSRMLISCTPWSDADVRGTIIKREEERITADPAYQSPWKFVHRSAYNDDGSAYFPEKLSLEVLEDYRENMSVDLFSSNYLCDPLGEQGFVHENEILFKPRESFPPLTQIRATVDPNLHKEAKGLGCYAAIGVGGYDRFANLYMLTIRGSRKWSTTEFINQLFALDEEFTDLPILIEDNHMAFLDHSIRLEEAIRSQNGKRRHLRIHWVPSGNNLSKYEKWDKMQPRFKNGRIILCDEMDPKVKAEVKEELVRGKAARFHDFLDMLAMQELGVRPKVAKDGTLQDQSAAFQKPTAEVDPRSRTWAALAPDLAARMPR